MAFSSQFEEMQRRLPGARALGLVAADGLLVATHGGEGLDFEALAAEVVAQAQGLSDERRGLELGDVKQWTLATDRYAVLLNRLDSESFLVAVLDRDSVMGKARFELRRAQLLFEDA